MCCAKVSAALLSADNFAVGSLGFSVEEALIPAVCGQLVNIFTGMFASFWLPKLGGCESDTYSMWLMIIQCALWTLFTSLPQQTLHLLQRCLNLWRHLRLVSG